MRTCMATWQGVAGGLSSEGAGNRLEIERNETLLVTWRQYFYNPRITAGKMGAGKGYSEVESFVFARQNFL
jgi:hypothetical protein